MTLESIVVVFILGAIAYIGLVLLVHRLIT